ncbi:MarR family winged helix-turn-helix transcriptional regulator [Marinactinospora thermotolerans]|uniref:DNA-binding transcriptional regulator, MarR family n=1 Tax=Marinactinospora thermotolerans DSM 45154 TaxID=1122192 RepID=A0A1T4TET3_9ACTN|nr:MarR family winged helix-turn-helix transcriptional regulator [Marinactinospora thermotolerans]SKA38962.1 DNA-binding transcriptional regulator, MarR family [Marinactinospora thermotolerans DSM 45154]
MERDDSGFSDFLHAWDELMGAVVRARSRGASGGDNGLTLPQALFLGIVRDLERPTVGAVAAAAGVASPTATRMLQHLERKGMVHRHRAEDDERVTLIALTPRGDRAEREWWERVRGHQRRLFSAIPTELRPRLIGMLHDMRQVIDDL